jgi:hypothetical protein
VAAGINLAMVIRTKTEKALLGQVNVWDRGNTCYFIVMNIKMIA